MRDTPVQVAAAVACETGLNLESDAESRGWAVIGVGPVGQHRDSDCLARSNFEVIYSDLSSRFGESVDIARFGHWAVGWVEEIIFDAGRFEVSRAVVDWRDKLEAYPVADEDHYCNLEFEELDDYLTTEVASIYRNLEVVPLTESGYEDLYRRTVSRVTDTTSSADDVGDITEDVFEAYCAVLLSEHDIPPEQLTI